jgi:hypothetical protein
MATSNQNNAEFGYQVIAGRTNHLTTVRLNLGGHQAALVR